MFILTAVLVSSEVSVWSDIVEREVADEVVQEVMLNPVRAGRLEILPIFSMRFSGGSLVYQAGMSLGYFVSQIHQLGGSFVIGNRAYNRQENHQTVQISHSRTLPSTVNNSLSVADGFGSSLMGFYRFNIPVQVKKQTFLFVEFFAGRDFWGWEDMSELGSGVGMRKVLSDRIALITQYSYVIRFFNGQRLNHHIVSAGVSTFFR